MEGYNMALCKRIYPKQSQSLHKSIKGNQGSCQSLEVTGTVRHCELRMLLAGGQCFSDMHV